MAKIWVLTGKRQGDNAQALALAAALGGECHEIKLDWTHWRVLPNALLGTSLRCITASARARLVGPWPDLVIGIGRRSVPVARWIKAQSGGKTKLVHLGNPRAEISHFDLIATTPQYGVPDGPNVLRLPLPFCAAPAEPEDLEYWQAEWRDLPRPLSGIILGGNAWPFRFTRRFGLELIDHVARQTRGGTAVIVASPRTPAHFTALLQRAIRPPHRVYGWGNGAANPYRSLLKLADTLTVSGDSVSMFNDVIMARKPFTVLPVPKRPLSSLIRLRDVEAVHRQNAADIRERAQLQHENALGRIRSLVS